MDGDASQQTFFQRERVPAGFRDMTQHFHRFTRDLHADAIARQDQYGVRCMRLFAVTAEIAYDVPTISQAISSFRTPFLLSASRVKRS